MPKTKSGPPYTDIPESVYVVVTNPWAMNSNPRNRVQLDFDRVAVWAQLALQQAGLNEGHIPIVECVYGMGTRSDVILQFAPGTNIVPLLGEHRWARFAANRMNPDDPRATCVFLYNWTNNGDPANHNWSEYFPNRIRLNEVPAKSPYPTPSWILPPSTLTNLVHSIPRPLDPLPVPDQEHNTCNNQASTKTPAPAPPRREERIEPEGQQPVAHDPASTSLFRPYEPPSQHPSHAQFLRQPQPQAGETSSSPTSSPSLRFVKKLDPYELEEDALDLLRSSHLEEGTAEVKNEAAEDVKPTHITVKMEFSEVKVKKEEGCEQPSITSVSESAYQPSQALIDAFNSLRRPEEPPSLVEPRPRDFRTSGAVSRTLPPASLGYKPSAKLEAHVNSLLQVRNGPSLSLSGGESRTHAPSASTIKREHEDDGDIPQPRVRRKIKVEED